MTKYRKILREVDLVIRNFGDNAPRRKRRRKRDLAEISSIESLSTTVRSSSAPIGLEQQYDELYKILREGLVGEHSEPDIGANTTSVSPPVKPRGKKNVSALLLGGRGQGKSLVLDRCLENLRQENGSTSKFRVVRINGVLLGRDVSVAVRTIVRQLSEIVAEETLQSQIKNATDEFETKPESPGASKTEKSVKHMMREKLRNVYMSIKKKESYEFRTRQTTFNSSLALLDTALQTACIDSIPILLVLDELDSFFTEPSKTGSSMSNSLEGNAQGGNKGGEAKSERHLLLYHILDRVNGSASLISLVGMTARLSVYSLFEKRVKSRAEGRSRIIHFGKPETFEALVNILLSNFDIDATSKTNGEGNCANTDLNYSQTLKLAVKLILLPNDNVQGDEDRKDLLPEDLDAHETARDEKYRVSNIFALHWMNGSSVRWFCRVVSIALTLFTEDIRLAGITDEEGNIFPLPNFDGTFLIEGLKAMGGTIDDPSKPVAPMSSEKPSNNCVSSIRISELMDLSWSQLAVLLSAKRILARDVQAQVIQEGLTKVLTFERMQNEYKSYFLAQGKGSGADRFDDDVFFKAFLEMMHIYFRPAKDHAGVGPNEYHFSNKFSPVVMDHQLLKKTPLHWNIHESELIEALKEQRLNCSAALRDWAK